VDLPELGLAIHGWSYPVGAVSEDPTPRFPAPIAGRVNIGLLHTNLGGQSGHSDYAPTTVSGLVARGYDYWALGHIHQRAHLESSGVHIVYPGNLQARHINEAGGPEGKGATLITVERGAIQRVEHRAVDVLRWAQITADVTGTAHFDEAVRHLQARVSEALAQAQLPTVLRVDVVGKTVAHGALTARTQDLLASLKAGLPQHVALYVERLRVQTEAPTVEGIDPLADLVSKIAEHLRTTPDAQAALRAELRRELEPILHKTHDNELLAEARSLVEGDALDALLAEATTTLLHRLRG
jgi:DNA repair exonuclease SbcCD nuclease subunit